MARASIPLAVSPECRGVIVLVDDDRDLRELQSLVLRLHGYFVYEACDGVEALAVLRRVSPNLILLDLQMPNMNGREFITRLRQSSSQHVPVCVISAEPDDPALEVEAQVRKPFYGAELLALVDRFCR